MLWLSIAGVAVWALGLPVKADEVHRKNRAANRYYEQGEFEKALETYEDALLNAPGEEKLKINKGSALHKLGRLQEAEEAYRAAEGIEDSDAKADLWYNLGTTLFRQGQQMMAGGGQGAIEKLEEARDSYIKALDARPQDEDAKWNLQLTQSALEQLKKQQQQQDQQKQNDKNKDKNQDKNKEQQNNEGDNNQDDKNKQDQNQQNDQQQDNQQNQDEQENQSQKDKKNEQDSDDQEKKDGEDREKEKREEESKGQEQKKAGEGGDDQSQQSKSAEEREKEAREKREAARLLEQYSDDHEDLNKPTKRIRVLRGEKPEKDW